MARELRPKLPRSPRQRNKHSPFWATGYPRYCRTNADNLATDKLASTSSLFRVARHLNQNPFTTSLPTKTPGPNLLTSELRLAIVHSTGGDRPGGVPSGRR